NAYVNSPQANNGGRLFHLPFNLNTFEEMWGVHTADEARRIIDEQRAEVVRQLGGREPANLEEQALLLVGRDIYETLIKGYTEKQWGRACTELPAFIIRRLPVRFTRDNNYFNDPWQGVPELGYNVLTDRLLEGTEVRLGVDYARERVSLNELADKVVFTGSIDEYFDFRLGRLEYRTVRFEHEVLDVPDYQHNAVVNFTSKEVPWTRIIEHKHFVELDEAGVRSNPRTVISREYSVEWQPGMEPFYPLNNERNTRLYEQYAELARAEKNVVFGGRLAEYRYYDMDKVIEKAMQMTI
ncbi:MAG: UDP-galactopyranose mutase, partial [Paludibacteraceae bacterium]|nr:UDP-galactopyranose mutase [Paludibacteraceae bacterium]